MADVAAAANYRMHLERGGATANIPIEIPKRNIQTVHSTAYY